MTSRYYEDKVGALRDLFGTEVVELDGDSVRVADRRYPISEDVIVLLDRAEPAVPLFAEDIQFTFGAEWEAFPDVLPEHRREFDAYFDLVNLADLANARVCDLGCGIGRWSYFPVPHCREMVLVDFSDAIHVARKNLAHHQNILFFQADLTDLPFRPGFADFALSLGVLHHLPIPALEAVRALRDVAPRSLVYLYYALDNRPAHFRALLGLVTAIRRVMSRIRSPRARIAFTSLVAATVYEPMIAIGAAADRIGASRYVPLYDSYAGKSFERIKQDVYDRFFTRIEQRVTQAEILTLRDSFREVVVSPNWPYWHFICRV
jgi:SAM-dependent methyltransferase